jgi:tRNA(Arg) A34 adenosine deaminase TadA
MDIQEIENLVGHYCAGCVVYETCEGCVECELALFIAWLKERGQNNE